jgi:hypothetical protein
MTDTPSMEDTLKAAQGLVDQRLAAVSAHKENADAEQAARKALAECERKSARTWADLLAAGWTPAELKQIPGFSEPKVRAPGRPRNKPRTARAETAPASVGVPAQSEAQPHSAPINGST